MERLVTDYKKATLVTTKTLMKMEDSSRTPHRGPLLSAQSRKVRR